MERPVCDNEGCFFSTSPEGLKMCEDCMTNYISQLDEDGLYDMYVNAVEEFKCNGTFRQQIRELDNDLVGEYDIDCTIFDQKMFQIINALLLMKS